MSDSSLASDPTVRVALARFFAENVAVAAPGLARTVIEGADALLVVQPEALSG